MDALAPFDYQPSHILQEEGLAPEQTVNRINQIGLHLADSNFDVFVLLDDLFNCIVQFLSFGRYQITQPTFL